MTLEERKVLGKLLHGRGYNCAQCVLLAFEDKTGLESATASRLAMGLGAGVGAQGEICGAITGMAIGLGLMRGEDPAGKGAVNKEVRQLTDKFKERNCDYVRCHDLKKKGKRPCDALISDAIEILDNHISCN